MTSGVEAYLAKPPAPENSAPRNKSKPFPAALGFRHGTMSVHTSRTMMFGELALVLDKVPRSARPDAYFAAIVQENVLGKPTQTTRQRTAKRLAELYALDPGCTLFRLLRHFWSADLAGRPMLAFLSAAARDPLLRSTTPFVLSTAMNGAVTPEQIAERLDHRDPHRFRATTLRSTAQNLASSWTQAGYLTGKFKKKRARPAVTPVATAFALLLSYLCGLRGKMMLDAVWARMLDRTPAEIADLASEASQQGWMNYKAAGSVVEITFPGLLTPQEERISSESD